MPTQISIHALLAESDQRSASSLPSKSISIHALLAESDMPLIRFCPGTNNFYPRSPCGERRNVDCNYRSGCHYFYPRSPCGERPGENLINSIGLIISIHALLAESDDNKPTQSAGYKQFLSTLSLRRATNCTSIGRPKRLYFYPRSPCGERRCSR